MMKRNLGDLINELKKRGFERITREDLSIWAAVFAIEDLTEKIGK